MMANEEAGARGSGARRRRQRARDLRGLVAREEVGGANVVGGAGNTGGGNGLGIGAARRGRRGCAVM